MSSLTPRSRKLDWHTHLTLLFALLLCTVPRSSISTLIVAWDTGYILLRPRSMPGGDLHWLWKPYEHYVNVDYIYGFPTWERHDGFARAQSVYTS